MVSSATPKTNSSKGETVSQSEIERLLSEISSGNSVTPELDVVAGATEPQDNPLERHDFPQASSFTARELRKLRTRHEEFVRSLAARLSLHLRLECGMQMSKFETSHFQQCLEGLANPTHLTLFKLEPCRGICLLDLPLRVGLCILDRELGGPGNCLDDTRDLNKLEARLLGRVVEMIVTEWCSAWSDLMDLRPVLLRYENSGRFLQVHSPQITMLVVGIEIRIGEVVEQIQLSVPCRTLEPLMAKLNAGLETVENPPVATLPASPKWNPVLDEMKLEISAELPGLELTAGELTHLKPGDVIQIAPEMFTQIQVCLGSVPKFVGNLGKSGQRMAVKIEKALGA